jgi:very-short-patch-repair endonuclease
MAISGISWSDAISKLPCDNPIAIARECWAYDAGVKFQRLMDNFFPSMESEIEKALFAFLMLEFGKYYTIEFQVFDWYRWGQETLGQGTYCYIQAQIANYRADFMFVNVDEKGVMRRIVVECDGHDFHERTKEQAARDRARDRWMTEHGIIVLRFTGSEIWRDAKKCVEQIGRVLFEPFSEEKVA